jgi:tetratricopeptide (TPR) repeat protein
VDGGRHRGPRLCPVTAAHNSTGSTKTATHSNFKRGTLFNFGWAHYLAACGEPDMKPLERSPEMHNASLARSDEYLQQSEVVARALGARHQLGMALAYRAAVRYSRGHQMEALSLLGDALRTFPSWDHVGRAHVYHNRGIMYSDRPQERHRALESLKQALLHAKKGDRAQPGPPSD